MAGQHSSAPSTVIRTRPRKRFTLEQANRTLPLVRRIVADILVVHGKAGGLHQIAEESVKPADRLAAEDQLAILLDRLHDLVGELTEIGCELKDFNIGLIDFTCRHEGRDIYLCWHPGEEQITHWHEIHAGFAGRQPVTLLKSEPVPEHVPNPQP